MKYYKLLPSPDLSMYVRFFWVLEGDASNQKPYIHRSMADGCCELIFHYKGMFEELQINGQTTSSIIAGIAGPSRKVSRYRINNDFGIFGAYLYPFAMSSLFGIPVSTIANRQPDLASLLGRKGKELEEKMMLAADNKARAAILSAFLESRIAKNGTVQPAAFASINHIIKTKGTVSVDTLASQFFLSTRQFERNFKEYAGFPPKLYSRIIRFQAAANEYTNNYKSLTAIAYKCGYYDQSHFIHDFKEFSGYHPKIYFSGSNEGTDWREV